MVLPGSTWSALLVSVTGGACLCDWVSGQKDGARAGVHAFVMFCVDGFFVLFPFLVLFFRVCRGLVLDFESRWCGVCSLVMEEKMYNSYWSLFSLHTRASDTKIWGGNRSLGGNNRRETQRPWYHPHYLEKTPDHLVGHTPYWFPFDVI